MNDQSRSTKSVHVSETLSQAFSEKPRIDPRRAQEIACRHYRDETRDKLWLYYCDDEFRYALPFLLQDLLDVEGSGIEISTGQSIILDNLDIYSADVEFRSRLEKRFDGLSRKQIEAVIAWLKLVKNWPEYSLYKEEIENSLLYWRDRLAGFDVMDEGRNAANGR